MSRCDLLMTPKELRSRRIALGITLDELAAEVRLPVSMVNAIEEGNEPVEQPEVFAAAFNRLTRRSGRGSRTP